ncbi:MAG TPA: serine hydrolase domain-containing protein [Holophagaceae bacterium]|jgi:D-alanyl-D-alanine carboxypeptidase|nr:serine hydrolase domain-containing protein [Holophagaceae bacterium]
MRTDRAGLLHRWAVIIGWMILSGPGLVAAAPAGTSVAEAAARLLRREISSDQGPGMAVLIAKGDRVIYQGARGRADLELGVPLNPRAVFRIGSITKTLTAATVLKLVSAGRLSLDAPLSRFLPGYPGGNGISIAQLLDHTAGISDAWEASPCEELDTAKLLKRIGAQPPDFAPGADWRYSNSGYMLLGAVIESVTGKPWDIAIRDLVLTPLGMARTGYFGDSDVVPGRAEGYSRDPNGAVIRAPYVSLTGPGAAGALSSTTEDLFHFVRALTTGRLLPSGLYQAMTTAKATVSGQSVPYGYGVMLGQVRGEPVIEHNGGIEGFATHYVHFLRQDITVIVLANSDAALNPRSLAHRFGALAIGKPYLVFHESVLDAEAMRGLAGSYRVGPSSTRTLFVQDGRLCVRRDEGPGRQLAGTQDGVLYWPGDETDCFRIIRDARGAVLALDFYADGMAPAQRELRIN